MTVDNNQAAENAKYLFKIFLGIFVLTYFFWYIGGGPERWNQKFKDLGFTDKSQRIVTNGVLLLEE